MPPTIRVAPTGLMTTIRRKSEPGDVGDVRGWHGCCGLVIWVDSNEMDITAITLEETQP